MASFEPRKIDLNSINNGKRFEAGDGVTPAAINAPIEAAAYLNAIIDSADLDTSVSKFVFGHLLSGATIDLKKYLKTGTTYIDWGDGTVVNVNESTSQDELKHTYENSGSYTLQIRGTRTISNTFQNSITLTDVIIGNTVILIIDDSFINCTGLKYVTAYSKIPPAGNPNFNKHALKSIYVPTSEYLKKWSDYIPYIISEQVQLGEKPYQAFPGNRGKDLEYELKKIKSDLENELNEIKSDINSSLDAILDIQAEFIGSTLQFDYYEDENNYAVNGIGNYPYDDVKVPSTYDNLSVVAINYTFSNLANVTSVQLPATIKAICDNGSDLGAFANMPNCKIYDLTRLKSVPDLHAACFNGIATDAVINVSRDMYSAFVSNDMWSVYSDHIRGV